MDVITTDVLVIGSGLTGLTAAIVCKENNLDVLVCSKASPGLGNCSVVSRGAFRSSGCGISVQDHHQATLKAGYGLNDIEKVDTMVQNAQPSLGKLSTYGVDIKKRANGFYGVAEGFGKEGRSLMKPMVRYADSLGVKFLSPFFSWEIIDLDAGAAGVWGFYKGRSEPVAISAKAVVLAAGGAGALYARTDNPPGITGDGYALAYRAGLPLMDMEFVQFYPLGTAEEGKPGRFLPPITAEVGDLLNVDAENIVEKYKIEKRPLAIVSRDSLSRAMALEVYHGRGIQGAIRVDLSNYEERWTQKTSSSPENDPLRKWFDGFLAGRRFLRVMPVSHFCMGGVLTDGACETRLPGLFAAGEVVGGLHGANRLGGNALSETVVFGNIAGQRASEFARAGKAAGNAEIITWVEGRFAKTMPDDLTGSRGALPGSHIKKRIQNIMWQHAGLIKSEASLLQAKKELSPYQGIIKYNQVKTKNMAKFLELKNMLLVAEMMVQASLKRQESRGSHYRLDYPETREGWARHVVIQPSDEEMMITLQPKE